MKKVKIYSSRTMIILYLLILICIIAYEVFCLTEFINFIIDNSKDGIIGFTILVGVGIALLFLVLVLFNKRCCRVYYNKSSNEISRKGFFFGFRYNISINEIKEVVISSFYPSTLKYIIFVDEKGGCYEGLSKYAFIRIEDTKHNREFIKQFWNGSISDYSIR